MSKRYPGGVITKSPATPTGPFQTGAAPGIWTLDQQLQYQQQGVWPTAGLSPNYIEDVFSTYLWTGNGTLSIPIVNGIDLSGKGGLVWMKGRNTVNNNYLYDTVRGVSSGLVSNTTNAAADYQALSAFNSNGFTDSFGFTSSETAVSWTFRKQPKFFDVVTYTGDGSTNQTISHSLGSTPGCVIIKSTTEVKNWAVWHTTIPFEIGKLNLTDAWTTFNYFITSSGISSTTFQVGGGNNSTANNLTNVSGKTYVAYLFAHNAGGFGLTGTDNVISCGSFTLTGGTDIINLGYEPQWLLTKKTNGTSNWQLTDSMRGMTVSNSAAYLYPNLANAEVNGGFGLVPTATGISIRAGSTGSPGDTFIYIAIRRGPMKVPTDATKVFSPQTATYSSNQVVTTGFPVDMLMMKGRTITLGTLVYDRLRGLASTNTSPYDAALFTSDTSAETAGDYTNTANNTGYQISPGFSGFSSVNYNFQRAPGFFDEVCYTGTGSATTVTHNLTVAPEIVINKRRSNTSDWNVSYGNFSKSMYLNTSDDDSVVGASYVTSPTTTSFSLSNNTFNVSGSTYVAYLFATCAGVSKVGSYTGNGTTQTINCGFTGGARFVLIKRTDSTGDWRVVDTARGMVSGTDPYLSLNSTAAEVNANNVYTVTTGFQLVSSDANFNANGGSYIFLAVA